MDLMKGCQSFLLENVTKMVVKYKREEKKYETVESKRAADKYVSARLKVDSTLTYDSYSEAAIRRASMTHLWRLTDREVELYAKNKKNIPYSRQEQLVPFAREEYILNYEEKNDYYRMIAGLPLSNNEPLFLDDEIYLEYEVEEKLPIHKLPQYVLNHMDDNGLLDKLLKKHPTHKYIKYLGTRRIDILTARQADNFDILYIPTSQNFSNYRDFLKYYDEAQAYIMTVVYNMYLSSKYELYDNYLAFIITVYAMNKLIADTISIAINRDFYDEESMRTLLESYGIPFSGAFSIYQNKLLTKNLNILLQKKSTNQVFIDILDLLGFDDFSIYKYYLVKQHKFDNDGNPIFRYQTYIDENGVEQYVLDENGEKVYDLAAMYDFYFSGIDIDNQNAQDSLTETENTVKYEQMVYDDPRWIVNDELTQKLLHSEFNYVETKYMDIGIVYKMHKIIFETVYLTRMILDKSKNTKGIQVSVNKFTDNPVSLFDLIVTLIALMCRYYDISPDILNTPSKILYIMGFNFEADFETLKKEVESNPDLYFDDLSKYIHDVEFATIKSINDMFVEVRRLEELLVLGMNKSRSIESYRAYKNLYDTLMYIRCNNDMYRMKDGHIAERFDEYLAESCPALYELYMEEDDEKVYDNISYITTKMLNLFTDTKYWAFIRLIDADVIDALLRLLRFFQSYTLDLKSSKLTLLLDSRYHNMAHFIFRIRDMMVSMNINDTTNTVNGGFNTFIKKLMERIEIEGIAKVNAKLTSMITEIGLDDRLFTDYDATFDAVLHPKELLHSYNRMIGNTLLTTQMYSKLMEKILMVSEIDIDEILLSKDKYKFNEKITPIDFFESYRRIIIRELMRYKTDMNLKDKLLSISKLNLEDDIDVEEVMDFLIKMTIHDMTNKFIDGITNGKSEIKINEKYNFKDLSTSISELYIENNVEWINYLKQDTMLSIYKHMTFSPKRCINGLISMTDSMGRIQDIIPKMMTGLYIEENSKWMEVFKNATEDIHIDDTTNKIIDTIGRIYADLKISDNKISIKDWYSFIYKFTTKEYLDIRDELTKIKSKLTIDEKVDLSFDNIFGSLLNIVRHNTITEELESDIEMINKDKVKFDRIITDGKEDIEINTEWKTNSTMKGNKETLFLQPERIKSREKLMFIWED